MKKTLRKNAVVLNLFEKDTGVLYGEDIFVSMEGMSIGTPILTRNGATDSDVAEALYCIEFHYNLLGLDLKENNSLSVNDVSEKLFELYTLYTEESEFEILFNGELLGEISSSQENKQITKSNPTLEQRNHEGSFNSNSYNEYAGTKPSEKLPMSSRVLKNVHNENLNELEYEYPKEEKVEKAKFFPPFYDDEKSIEQFLMERGVRRSLIKWILSYRKHNADRFKNAPQEIVDRIEKKPQYIGKVSVLEKALAAMMRDQPLSLKGEAGTGKTTLVETISCLLNLPLFSINGSLESNKATLVGEKDIVGKGRLITKDGQMTKAMKWGGILYIDEINMMRPDVLAIVNGATDHRKTFYNDVAKETIVGHTDYRFISAMNIGYAGVKKINEATSDRTASIVLTYLGKNEMKTLLRNLALRENEQAKKIGAPELEEVDIVKLTKIYLELTIASKKGYIPVLAASTRNIILLAKIVPVLGYQLALEMMLDKFDESAPEIVGVLSSNELLDELGVNPNELLNLQATTM
ncbi:MoxR family ATPase [Priestia megaterium]|uniref:MoxR family ATPase n=1 Tax=Priestia megaterium TaxID=1404 RepID=UPI003100FBC9